MAKHRKPKWLAYRVYHVEAHRTRENKPVLLIFVSDEERA
jgi:hypothetical protein